MFLAALRIKRDFGVFEEIAEINFFKLSAGWKRTANNLTTVLGVRSA
jgi:hypothetical protein